jgi:hypothetical protein
MLERIGEIGEPCGEPTMMSIGSDTKPLNLSWTIRSARKDVSHSQISWDPESVDQPIVVNVVEETLDVELERAAATSFGMGGGDVVCECEAGMDR